MAKENVMTVDDWIILTVATVVFYSISVFISSEKPKDARLACPRCKQRGRALGSWKHTASGTSWFAMKCDNCGAAWNIDES